MATEYTIDNALRVLPHLVHCAQIRKTITYGDLAAKIGRHHRAAQHLLCHIRDEICAPRGLPLLTAIVINKNTGLPGPGWLEGAYGLSDKTYKEKYETYRDQVFACDKWDSLLKELGLSPIEKSDGDLDEEGRAFARYLERTGQAGEGDDHRRLKEYVAEHPAQIGVQPAGQANQEYMFASGDRCDVVFSLDQRGYAVVEVKNGERGELVKGIYQAVKYRALMEAEKGHGQPYPVSAYLVAYDHIPDDIEALAIKLQVRCFAISRSNVNKL